MKPNRFTHIVIFGQLTSEELVARAHKALKGTRFQPAENSRDINNYDNIEIGRLQDIDSTTLFRQRLSNNIAITVLGDIPSADAKLSFKAAPCLQFADAIVWYDGANFMYKGKDIALVWLLAQLRP